MCTKCSAVLLVSRGRCLVLLLILFWHMRPCWPRLFLFLWPCPLRWHVFCSCKQPQNT